ncbi:hypothetical protein BD410DRAFT_788006 [Rickenella mellea]|uniref:Uncharacterized protein n=1 Tax=Rickenella mellea TaxID=50990 RepID=A0A4Y7Q4Y0_9AGAM|nr:hypothetical protein BD410DRAFT_788006 [Rickenella mellea]
MPKLCQRFVQITVDDVCWRDQKLFVIFSPILATTSDVVAVCLHRSVNLFPEKHFNLYTANASDDPDFEGPILSTTSIGNNV